VELGKLVMCTSFRPPALRPPPNRPIPLLVAAKGRRMLRLTARYADAWNTAWFGPPDELLTGGWPG
jgi:alkanesulfonate monooxygenase SsuD/methylene tetrahydromethanopterin reductase-like flavin-dependent oxidoreductase (luciferase family)